MPTYLIDGTTPLPENGETGWGNKLNAAITAIDSRFTWTGGEAVVNKVAASGITGTTLPSTLVSSSLTSVGTLTGLSVSGNVTISGDFTVNGTTTTINTTTLNVSDNLIVLNNDVTGTPTENAGIEVERGGSTNVQIRWNETSDKWEFTNDGTTYNVFNAAADLTGTALPTGLVTSSLTSVGTIATGVWQGTAIAGQYGGTGVNNSGKTITLGGNLTTSGAYAVTLTATNTTSVTLPTTGTLATLAGSESLTNKKLGSLTTNGIVTTSGGDGTLSVTATTGSSDVVLSTDPMITSPTVLGGISTTSTSFSLLNDAGISEMIFATGASAVTIGSIIETSSMSIGASSISMYGELTVSGTTILGPASVTQKPTSTYTLELADQGKVLETTHVSGCTITVPPESSVSFPVGSQIMVVRNSSGPVQFQAGAGVTLRSDASKFFISTQYSAVTLIKRGADEWYLVGNLSAS